VPDPNNPQSLNHYTYCLNNPLKYIDPSGHDPWNYPPGADPYEWGRSLIERGCDNGNGCSGNQRDNRPKLPLAFKDIMYRFFNFGNDIQAALDKTIEDLHNLFDPEILVSDESNTLFTIFPGLPPMTANEMMDYLSLISMVTGNPGGFLKYPKFVNLSKPNSLVSYAKMLQNKGTILTAKEANQLVVDCQKANINVRFDTGHKAPWDKPHLNIGKEGQAHVLVSPEWTPPNWVQRGK
jgi:hypothetical protein